MPGTESMMPADPRRPQMAVVIHTEEEFDWSGGFFRTNTQVSHGTELVQFIERMLGLDAKVTLAMDYAFASSAQGEDAIKQLLPRQGEQIEFASHLHPWVNPPFHGEARCSAQDSFPGNLPEAQEHAKLLALTELIQSRCNRRPTTYLAGRYGVGANSYRLLQSLGYTCDLSVTPLTSFADQSGPDFSDYSNHRYAFEGGVGVPHTTGLVSVAPGLANYFNNRPSRYRQWTKNAFSNLLLKLLRVKKWRLSPEGFSSAEMKQLCRTLVNSGVTDFVFSFHSPSVKVGLTPYVGTCEDLRLFEKNCLEFLSWFKESLSGEFVLAQNLESCHLQSKGSL